MRRVEETGLTQQEYENLKQLKTRTRQRYVLSRYNLDFDDYHADGQSVTTNFAACATPHGLFKAVGGSVYKMTSAETGWVEVFTYTPYDIPPEFYYDEEEDEIHFYRPSNESLQIFQRTSTDGGATFGTATSIATFPGPYDFFSVSRPDRVHAACRDSTTQNNLRFYVADAGNVSASDIFWAHPISGFAAAKVDDVRDTLILTTDLPVLLAQRLSNTTATEIRYKSGGVIAFTYQYGAYSDHYNVEIFDDINASMSRQYVRVEKVNGIIIATCAGTDGSPNHYIRDVCIYRSKDGKNWQQAQIYPTNAFRKGCRIGVYGNHAYLISSNIVHRSDATAFVGHKSPAITDDITDYVVRANRNVGQVSQSALTLSNENNRLYVETPLSQKGVFMLEQYLSYYSPNDGKFLELLIATDEVDSIETSQTLGRGHLDLRTRDRLKWMVDGVESYHIREYETGVIGPDNFRDDGTTGFGGLRHTATKQGNWRTEGNELKLVSSNKVGIAFNTYDVDPWNGSVQVMVRMPQHPSDIEPTWDGEHDRTQFGGVIFKAYDSSNYWSFIAYKLYDNDASNPGLSHFRVVHKKGGVEAIKLNQRPWEMFPSLFVSGTDIPWGLWIGLKVVVRYQRVSLYASLDGKNWVEAEQGAYIIDGSTYTNVNQSLYGSQVDVERGFFGYTGRGASLDDVFDYEDPDWEAPPVEPPTTDPGDDVLPEDDTCDDVDWTQYDPGTGPYECVGLDSGHGTAFTANKDGLYRTDNLSTLTPTWNLIFEPATQATDADELINDFILDPYSPARLGTGTAVWGYVLTNKRLYRSEDMEAEAPVWEEKQFITGGILLRCPRGIEGGVVIYGKASTTFTEDRERDPGDDWDYIVDFVTGENLDLVSLDMIDGTGNLTEYGLHSGGSWPHQVGHFKFRTIKSDTAMSPVTITKVEYESNAYGTLNRGMGRVTTSNLSGTAHVVGQSSPLPSSAVSTWHESSPNYEVEDANGHFGVELYVIFDTGIEAAGDQSAGRWIVYMTKFRIAGTGPDPFNSIPNSQQNYTHNEGEFVSVVTIMENNGDNVVVSKVFGAGDFSGQGMDCDDYAETVEDLLVRAAGQDGRVYEIDYTDIVTSTAYSGSFPKRPITTVRLWYRRLNGDPNDTEEDLHGMVGFSEDALTSYQWTMDDWFYKDAQYTAYNIIKVGDKVLHPAGPNAYERWGGNSRDGAGIFEVFEDEEEKKYLVITRQALSVNPIGAVDSVNNTIIELDFNVSMLMFGYKSRDNLYTAGKDGVFISSDRGQTFLQKCDIKELIKVEIL